MRRRGVLAIAVLSALGAMAACSSLDAPATLADAGAPDATPVDDAAIDVTPAPDASADSDADAGPVDAGPCEVTCASHHREDGGACDPLVFVTTQKYPGDLGADGGTPNGLPLADQICTNEATAAGRRGAFVAWLSTTTSDIITRVTATDGANRPVWLADGTTKIGASYKALITAEEPLEPISLGANGASVPVEDQVWTGTTVEGAAATYTCQDWQSALAADEGQYGITLASSDWTDESTDFCDKPRALYCFEVAP